MKIFFYRYNSICEPDMINAFKSLGLDVIEETIEMRKKDLLPSECVNLVTPILSEGGFSFAFTINFFPWLSDVCNILNITYISLIVDSPVLELFSSSFSNKCNRIFLFDNALYNDFSPYNPGHVFHVPLATNIERNDSVITKSSEMQKSKYKCDISFIGSTYHEKCPFNNAKLPSYEKGYIDGLIEAQLKVYGYNFIEELINEHTAEVVMDSLPDAYTFPESFRKDYRALVSQYYISVKVSEQERLRTLKALSDKFNVDIYTGSDTSSMPHIHNKGFADTTVEMPLIFNQSKINLNITSKAIRTGLPLRIFDILGCRGFLITNYQAELPDYFEIGKDLIAYTDTNELENLCRYYLMHEDERLEIAENGYNKIKKYYTFNIRALQMIDLAFPKTQK